MLLPRTFLIGSLFVSGLAVAAPASPIERAARKAAFARLTKELPMQGHTAAELRANTKLIVKASPTRAGIVNLALRTKEDGKWTDMAIVSTWNSRTQRFSQLKFALQVKPAMFRDAVTLERTVKSGVVLGRLF